jgi:phosphatidylglycerol:prolipoprotein diacylglycerol transferase
MPSGFTIGPLPVRFYGIIIMLGVLAGAWLASKEAKRRGQDPNIVWDGLIWVIIAGVIGSRLWHVFTPTPTDVAAGLTTMYYLTHPLDMLAIWKGGLGVPGAVIGGALAIFIFARRKNLDVLVWMDIAAPGLALAQAIGRWGNFVNQELYGPPTDLPWAIPIEPQYRLPGYQEYTHFHPLFLYESLWNLMNMAILLWVGRRFEDRLLPGDIFLGYLIIYPLGRFLLEFIRLDSAQIAGINANQTVMLVVAITSVLVILWRHWRHRRA